VADYRVDRLADDAAGLIQALGRESAFVAAHDWGGGVAWQLAIRHPERVRKLAVIDTPHPRAGDGFVSKEERIAWYRTFFQLPWLPERAARLGNWGLVARMLRNTSAPGTFPDSSLDLFRSAWDRDGAMATMIDWYRAARREPAPEPADWRVHVPTLVAVAPHDAFIPGDLTRRSLDWVDDGRMAELPRGTHWVIQEDPDGIARLLADFFGAP
jgi:pimeloyl-ACP methyl ester carboxylesterase